MPERKVDRGVVSYRDETGKLRYALQGETVDVGKDHVESFDTTYGVAEPKAAAPQKKAAPPVKKTAAPQKRGRPRKT